MNLLEKKVAELENEILLNGDLKSKLKQDNTHLVHRYGPKPCATNSQAFCQLPVFGVGIIFIFISIIKELMSWRSS